MDKFQAAFEILYFLAACDGKVSYAEVNVIDNFLNVNFGKINFNAKTVIQSITNMTGQGMLDELGHAALVFKNNSSAQDRNILLDFCLSLIGADGIVTLNEKDVFHVLGNIWNVDIDKYLAEKIYQY